MKRKELNEKVQLLKAGVTVEIAGDTFYAVNLGNDSEHYPCGLCELDSICRDDVFDVCCELETAASHHWLLKLAHP